MPRATIVIPCFNEERRLDDDALLALARLGGVALLLVDDGSTDGTRARLQELERAADTVTTLELDRNGGKAEAVRVGLLRAIEEGAEIVAYYDADLSTPPDELLRLVETLEGRPELAVVMAARVALLGRRIERQARRHYLGRIFATFASLSLGLAVYDTQCGAKVFRVTPALGAALARPFHSSWAFDVELLARLLYPDDGLAPTPPDAVIEVPLRAWHDVAGSKLGPIDMARAALDLGRVARETRRGSSWRRLHP